MGIFAGGKSARASGGTVTTAGPFTVHAFTTTGANTFTPATTGFVDILLVGGGGGTRSGSPGQGSGAGGGGTIFKKMIPVTAGTPYSINVGTGGPAVPSNGVPPISPGPNGGDTTFTYSEITTTAYGGAGGTGGLAAVGVSQPLASGSGGREQPGGTGAGVLGIGFSGGQGVGGSSSGGGGGAGGAGSPGTSVSGANGGASVPIAYFTGVSTHTVSGGGGGTAPVNVGTPGGGIYGTGATGGVSAGQPGVAYIRYI